MDYNDAISVLHQWGGFGAALKPVVSLDADGWAAAKRLIQAAGRKQQYDIERLRAALGESRQRLRPLQDPFDSDLGVHRWLCNEREEAYSDWLEWIVRQIDEPEEIFNLFGVTPDVPVKRGASTIQREYCIPYGHEEREGRLDLVLRFGEQAIMVVEVKVGDADTADTLKHKGYRCWLKQQGRGCKYGVLVATDAAQSDYHGFTFRSWASICVAVRRLAQRHVSAGKLLQAAMMLAFVAAVEQNLLGFCPHVVANCGAKEPLLFNSTVVDHIEASVSDGRPNDRDAEARPKSARTRFLVEGTSSYLQAATAVLEYQRAVQRECRVVMEEHLSDYASALRVNLKRDQIRDFSWPSWSEWDGTYWCLGAQSRARSSKACRWDSYCALQYDVSGGRTYCWVGQAFSKKELARGVMRHFRKDVHYDDDYIVWIEHPLQQGEVDQLQPRLTELMTRWIKYWEDAGGVAILK